MGKRRQIRESGGGSQFREEVQIVRFAPLAGRWETSEGAATYSPDSEPATQPGLNSTWPPFGVVRAAGDFADGTIRALVTVLSLDTSKHVPTGVTGGILFGWQGFEQPYFAAHIGGFDRAYGILIREPNLGQWRELCGYGDVRDLKAGQKYELRLRLKGQLASLQVDGIDVTGEVCLPSPIAGRGLGLYAYGKHKVHFENVQLCLHMPKAFIAMPFNSEPFETLYRKVIRKVVKKAGLVHVRVDEIRAPSDIIGDIRREIQESQVVIAEISNFNPNVFYEIGYAHALNKPVILLILESKLDSLPFDVRPYRAIPYEDSVGGAVLVRRRLQQFVSSVVGTDSQIGACE